MALNQNISLAFVMLRLGTKEGAWQQLWVVPTTVLAPGEERTRGVLLWVNYQVQEYSL